MALWRKASACRRSRRPPDLSNWECLTYPKGNYAAVRRSSAEFYRENYYLAAVAAKKS
jgi:hypothetical protein